MSTLQTDPQTSSRSTPLPSAWVDRLFEVFNARYGAKFADLWRDLDPGDLKLAWSEDLAGYSGDEIRRGLELSKTRTWPPTLPEFMLLCRPLADSRADWAEACEQMPVRLRGDGTDRWSRVEVYWAAVAIGNHDLQTLPWEQLRARWERALATAKTDPIPQYRRALPPPGRETVTRDEAVRRIGEVRDRIQREFSTDSVRVGRQWAIDLMHKEAAGESVAFVAQRIWREALGLPEQIDAAQAVRTLRAAA